ncbi:MAG: glycosyltransferase family 4 protein [Thermofilum sp.]|nr:glycosyltransferase family 4 protein [Thermofilum sp.]
MASVLAENGFNVTILEWDRDAILPPIEYTKNILIRRMRLKAPFGYRLIFKIIFWQFYITIAILLENFTVIQPQNLDNLLPVWLLRPLKKFKIVYDIADFYADAYIPPNMTLIRRIIAWFERLLAKTVDSIILVDESRKQQINIPGWIIYNSPPDIFNALKINNNAETSFKSKFVIFYAGMLARDRGLDTLIKAVWGLVDVELIIAGFGELNSVFSKINKWKNNIRFLGRIAYNDVLKLTASSDCIVALYDPRIPNNVFASPNKLFEAMMCAKPIIVNHGTNAASIVLKEKCGLVVSYGDYKDLRNAIMKLKADPLLKEELGKNGRRAYEQKYSWKLMEAKLLRIYNSLIEKDEK